MHKPTHYIVIALGGEGETVEPEDVQMVIESCLPFTAIEISDGPTVNRITHHLIEKLMRRS
jgi:hypothetical protein